MPTVLLELTELVLVGFKKVSSPLFILPFVWNLALILTIILIDRHKREEDDTNETASKR